MATNYWNPSTTSSFNYFGDSTASTSTFYINPYWIPKTIVYSVRKILVECPEKWTDEQGLAFVELVNLKTKTGWKVTLVIKNGSILITDPNIEKRAMIDFIPLLKDNASKEDCELINDF